MVDTNKKQIIDTNSLNNLCENNNIKNLVKLSENIDLCLFNKKYNKWNIKPKDKLLKECIKKKQNEIKNASHMLSNLAKLSSNIDINPVYNNLNEKINNIDNVIKYINDTDININKKNLHDTDTEKYIESYSNC
jgi:hypothetical protein